MPDGRRIEIGGREQLRTRPTPADTGYLTEFRLEAGLPVWRYDVERPRHRKRVFLPHMQNTVHVMYELAATAPSSVELALRPSVNFRPQEAPVSEPLGWPYEFRADRRSATRSRCKDSAAAAAAADAARPATPRSR